MVRKPWGAPHPMEVPKNRGPEGIGFWIGPMTGPWAAQGHCQRRQQKQPEWKASVMKTGRALASGDLPSLGLGSPSMWCDARLTSPYPHTPLRPSQASPRAHTLTCSATPAALPGPLPSKAVFPSGPVLLTNDLLLLLQARV